MGKYLEYIKEGSVGKLRLLESPIISAATDFDKEIAATDYLEGVSRLELDCSGICRYDTYFIALLNQLEKECSTADVEFELIGAGQQMQTFIDTLKLRPEGADNGLKRNTALKRWFISVGDRTVTILKDSKSFVEFIGEMILAFLNLIIHPTQMRWKDFPYHFLRAGVNALPISFLIVFLIGVISGYQGALQLSQFGADIYIADLVGVSITRELAPLMTAILVAGRSGSAFAAEIGTMKVSEEVDALQSMGFDTMKFLVLPRVLAVTAAMPILVLLTDLAGIIGGGVAAMSTLDITLTGYTNQLNRALDYADVFSGIGKSIVFGFLVATVGCFRGMQVRGGAESVGRYTTAAVVSGVLLIIVSDAIFTFLFQTIGL